MRNKMIMAAAAVAALAAPALAQAQPAWQFWNPNEPQGYATLGYGYTDDIETGAVQGRLGVELNRYFAIETEIGVGVKDKDYEVLGRDATMKHEWDAAGYVVGKVPVGENFEVFARGGYGHTEMKREIAGITTDEGGDHWSYGAGAEFKLNPANGIRADWTRKEFKGDRDDQDVYGVSYVRRF